MNGIIGFLSDRFTAQNAIVIAGHITIIAPFQFEVEMFALLWVDSQVPLYS